MHFYRQVGYHILHEYVRCVVAKHSKTTPIETRLKLTEQNKNLCGKNNFNIGI